MIQLFNWFRRGYLERGLDRELQYHFDRRIADLTSAGIPEPEARRRVAAALALDQVREEVRDVWLTRWFRDFLYDLRFSARSFLRSLGFTATTLLTQNLDGLDKFVPQLTVKRIPDGSHWVVHEKRDEVNADIRDFIR